MKSNLISWVKVRDKSCQCGCGMVDEPHAKVISVIQLYPLQS